MADVADREYAGHAGLHRQGRPVERPAGRQASAAGEVRNHRENAKDAHQAYRRSGLQVRRRPRWHSHPGGEAGLAPIKALSYVKRGLEALKIRWIEIEDAKAERRHRHPGKQGASRPGHPDHVRRPGQVPARRRPRPRPEYRHAPRPPPHRPQADRGPLRGSAQRLVLPDRTGRRPFRRHQGHPRHRPGHRIRLLQGGLHLRLRPAHRPERAAHSRQHDGCCPVPGPRAHAYRHPVAHAPDGQPSPSLPAPADVVTLLDLW